MCPILIFKNDKSRYPIRNIPDNVPGVTYRSSPTAFININIMQMWLQEPRCWGPGGPFQVQRMLWMDKAGGHSSDASIAMAKSLNMQILFFPANATDRIQPADRFPIQKIKTYWRKLSEKETCKPFVTATGCKEPGLLVR